MVEMEDAMKRWIKRGICALTLGAMLSANVLAAELSLSFDKQGTTAAVELRTWEPTGMRPRSPWTLPIHSSAIPGQG